MAASAGFGPEGAAIGDSARRRLGITRDTAASNPVARAPLLSSRFVAVVTEDWAVDHPIHNQESDDHKTGNEENEHFWKSRVLKTPKALRLAPSVAFWMLAQTCFQNSSLDEARASPFRGRPSFFELVFFAAGNISGITTAQRMI
jgi:hypothetical protein